MPNEASSTGRVTLKDVALQAGVTVSTVSKVVNGRSDVGSAVRQRVLDTVELTGYRPNSLARGLRSQRSDTIAIITDDLEGIFTNAMMRGVEDVASQSDIGVLLCNSYGDEAKETMHIQRLLDRQVGALIFMSGNRVGPRRKPALPIPSNIPFVYLYEYGEPGIASVLPDDAGGAALAVEHLIKTGSKRIACLAGPMHWEATQDRIRGFKVALAARGRCFDQDFFASSPTWEPEDAYDEMIRLLERCPDLDGVFCGSDDIASGALNALSDRGLQVPDEFQVVGFDNRSLSRHTRPPLTTIELPLEEMGAKAGSLVMASMGAVLANTGQVRVPCRLIERDTTRVSATG